MVEWITLGLLLFVRGTDLSNKVRLNDRDGRIRCPRCGWEPRREDRWSCGPQGCGHIWNTFETLGRCPACERFWDETACLRCGAWSPHDEWYESAKDGK